MQKDSSMPMNPKAIVCYLPQWTFHVSSRPDATPLSARQQDNLRDEIGV